MLRHLLKTIQMGLPISFNGQPWLRSLRSKTQLISTSPLYMQVSNIYSATILCTSMRAYIYFMRGSRGGVRGVRTPLEFAKLNFADITENAKKLVIFHICALPQFYVKQNLSAKLVIISFCVCVMGFFLLKVGPPLEKFSGSAPAFYGKI